MLEENKKSFRGTIPFSKAEYEDISREEDKKNLDSIDIEPSYIDEFEPSSIISISENDENYNGDFDFEVEEKPKELSPMQKARTSRLVELVDDEKYLAELIDISPKYLQDKKMGILTFSYNVYKNGEFLKKIEDQLFFDENNLNSFNYNEEKLSSILIKYRVELTDSDYEDVNSIAKAIKHLIGTRVILTQKTKGEYKNYRIVSLESEV